MSARYTADGKRKSSQTHAGRGHECGICGRVVFGNGGQSAHGRAHVKRGEAVELVKHYSAYPPIVSRFFLATDDTERITHFRREGFEEVSA